VAGGKAAGAGGGAQVGGVGLGAAYLGDQAQAGELGGQGAQVR
jgi:hypothetical protein